MAAQKPYTPITLAERWDCSSQHIRDLIDEGAIPCFRLGKLIRIPAAWVDQYEQAAGWNLNSTGASTASFGTQTEERNDEASALPIITREGVV